MMECSTGTSLHIGTSCYFVTGRPNFIVSLVFCVDTNVRNPEDGRSLILQVTVTDLMRIVGERVMLVQLHLRPDTHASSHSVIALLQFHTNPLRAGRTTDLQNRLASSYAKSRTCRILTADSFHSSASSRRGSRPATEIRLLQTP